MTVSRLKKSSVSHANILNTSYKMRLSYFIFAVILVQCSAADRDTVPVFLLDYDGVMANIVVQANPFSKLTTPEFVEIIYEAQKNSKVVILFIEDTFCFEDISRRDKQGCPFFNLHLGLSKKKVLYFPAVSQPFKTLKQKFPQQPFNVFHLSSMTTKLQVYDEKSKHFYIYFQDAEGDSRSQSLRQHDLIIEEVYTVVRRIYDGPVVAFYTGKVNPIPMHKMNFVTVKPTFIRRNPGVTITSTGALFRLIGVYTTTGSRRSMFSQIPLVAEETWTNHQLSTRMAYSDFELQFNFKFEKDVWTIDNVMLLEGGEEVGKSELKAAAPWGCSYVCGEPLVIVNMRDGSAVIVSQYQIQPYKDKVDLYDDHLQRLGRNSSKNLYEPIKRTFGPSVNCGPYFNANILAALFVTFLCIGILTYGITTMYNCNSNDRYDDPHGKPLTIAADSSH
ncbi:V-type proton ATPase subunit S1-like [Epargyreus clarus]|uniref:V-type proton ATPase subunit S1-like n=1 Tax=Epargyreus clarus TaxID=520877 RepID=UPI003C2B6D75